MHRDDKSKFLLYMEPKGKFKAPVNDELTNIMEWALSQAKEGAANYNDPNPNPEVNFSEGVAYKGVHRCSCGEVGGNKDYILENGMITNELCVHYVQWHRDEINDNDKEKLFELFKFYKLK
jgi:hypothetical protein